MKRHALIKVLKSISSTRLHKTSMIGMGVRLFKVGKDACSLPTHDFSRLYKRNIPLHQAWRWLMCVFHSLVLTLAAILAGGADTDGSRDPQLLVNEDHVGRSIDAIKQHAVHMKDTETKFKGYKEDHLG